MTRSVDIWTGKTDDSMPPPRVRDRIFERHQHRCHLCGNEIKSIEGFDLDHVKALINGGANTEDNLAPVHRHCHISKNALDVREKAKVARTRQKHNGIEHQKVKIQGRGFPASAKSASRQPKQPVQRQWSFYQPKEETQPCK